MRIKSGHISAWLRDMILRQRNRRINGERTLHASGRSDWQLHRKMGLTVIAICLPTLNVGKKKSESHNFKRMHPTATSLLQ